MKKILIVEDEVKLREELKTFLEASGYEVMLITCFDNTLGEIIKNNCDLILLDINLPGINGQFLCKEVRKSINTPIIIVTSRNTEIDELISINYGADDFITKPYNAQILLARINRLLGRNYDNKLSYKDIVIDMSCSRIIKDDAVMDLSKNEIKILYFLVKNKGKIISRDALMNYLWETDEFIDDNTLTVNINRLRNKLSSFGVENIIITKRSQGYIVL